MYRLTAGREGAAETAKCTVDSFFALSEEDDRDFDRETGAGAACDADVDGSAVSLTAEDAEGETIVDTFLTLGALNESIVIGSLDVLAVALRILS